MLHSRTLKCLQAANHSPMNMCAFTTSTGSVTKVVITPATVVPSLCIKIRHLLADTPIISTTHILYCHACFNKQGLGFRVSHSLSPKEKKFIES